MSKDDKGGASGRAVVNGAASGSALRASVPDAGDTGIIDGNLMLDRYDVVRIVKARKIGGMWDVEVWRVSYTDTPGKWDHPTRRKVTKWFPLPPTVSPETVARKLRDKAEAYWQEARTHRENYHASITSYAQAIEARSGQTAGLDRNGESAVGNADAPQSPSTAEREARP